MKRPLISTAAGISSVLLSSLSFAGPMDTFRMNAPADTVLYYEGDLVANTAGLSSLNTSEADTQQALQQVFSNPNASEFLTQLISDITRFSQGEDPTLLNVYGFSTEDSAAFYFDGGLPIFQASSRNPQTFVEQVTAVAKAQQFEATREMWKGAEVFTWPLTIDEFEGESPYLAISTNQNTVSLGLFFKSDTLEKKRLRLGLVKESMSINKTNKMDTLIANFKLKGTGVGFVDLEQMALMATRSKNHSGSQDLQNLGLKATPKACSADIQMFAQSAPIIVSSFHSKTAADGAFEAHYKTIWEIKSDAIKSNLQQLNGHLSATTLKNSDTLASLGLGINVNTLTPVLTNFWSQFQNLELSCPELKQLQTDLKSQHPSQLAMFAGLAHGVTGLSVDLFDFDYSPSRGLTSLDGIVSVFAENPANLAAIAANIAPVKGLPLPQDGTPADLDIPDVPASINVKGRVKGKALMVYAGPNAATLSEEKSQEILNKKGLLGLAIDYADTVNLIDNMLGMNGNPGQPTVDTCIAVHQELQQISNQNVKSTTEVTFNNYGVEIDMMASARPSTEEVQLAGSYQVDTMGDDCRWSTYGYETINADGTGSYNVIDDSDSNCDLFNVKYEWQQQGDKFIVVEKEVLGRESCDAELQMQEPSSYQCELLATGNSGFECLLDEENLYRYRVR
ncbi:hypothetical protein [Marinomonas mediterranea]|uniref:Uncharacterized protein n=1 Tax=Marinomonas mediterranea (strain ATCC 700492 / JCM 21426 / NBRC 103028 / MMB-1) TaxID=717774 RepID=F2JUM3_MARM1|nr:hypothetical protein [Marinomonas mediterranea]ADZ89356.1 hypothetical protein Marme_0050 [Marinomonas mediterranea MMB-1]WCN15621.1 hypothetical protein GV053_00245 [Marinomonas mediterranea MMB-1]